MSLFIPKLFRGIKLRHISTAIILCSWIFLYSRYPGGTGYREIFGRDYSAAMYFIDSNPWIKDSLQKDGTDPCIGISVVFPELIRYSMIRDKIEIRALQTLYIQYGKYYSDFSIGHFQMKPSFAEDLEKECLKNNIKYSTLMFCDTTNSVSSRKERIGRLSTMEGQVRYLSAFCIIMSNKLSRYNSPDKTSYIRMLSSAYNYGFMKDIHSLKKASRYKNFYTGIIPAPEKYNYSDISLDYYVSNCR